MDLSEYDNMVDGLDIPDFDIQHGSGLNMATNETILSNLRGNDTNLKFKEVIELLRKDKIVEASKALSRITNIKVEFREALFHYLMCVFDPFKYQFYIPMPFLSSYSLIHYTHTGSYTVTAEQRTTFTHDPANYSYFSVYTGPNITRAQSYVSILPSAIRDILIADSVQVVSTAMVCTPDSSVLNINGRAYSYVISGSQDPTPDLIVNSICSYNGHLKDGAYVSQLPQVANYKISQPIIGVTVSGVQETVTLSIKLVVMGRFKSPYNNIVSKISRNYDGSIYNVQFSELIDNYPELFTCSATTYNSSRRTKRSEEVAFLVSK